LVNIIFYSGIINSFNLNAFLLRQGSIENIAFILEGTFVKLDGLNMREEITNIYSQAVANLTNMIDPNFRNELLKSHAIESLDPKWKAARKNIEGYINHITQQNQQASQWLSCEGYFLFEDIAALMLDLLWQSLHSKLETEETIFYYKNYKVQISDKNLLTWGAN